MFGQTIPDAEWLNAFGGLSIGIALLLSLIIFAICITVVVTAWMRTRGKSAIEQETLQLRVLSTMADANQRSAIAGEKTADNTRLIAERQATQGTLLQEIARDAKAAADRAADALKHLIVIRERLESAGLSPEAPPTESSQAKNDA